MRESKILVPRLEFVYSDAHDCTKVYINVPPSRKYSQPSKYFPAATLMLAKGKETVQWYGRVIKVNLNILDAKCILV